MTNLFVFAETVPSFHILICGFSGSVPTKTPPPANRSHVETPPPDHAAGGGLPLHRSWGPSTVRLPLPPPALLTTTPCLFSRKRISSPPMCSRPSPWIVRLAGKV